jgi:fatty-acyl-CoA synthase
MRHMRGLMQDYPLTVNSILDRGSRLFAGKSVVTATCNGFVHNTFGELGLRARRLANVLDELDITDGATVASFAWNTANHLALYFAVPASGRVLHTNNIRYSEDQFLYTFQHSGAEALFVDRSLLPLLDGVLPKLTAVRSIIVMDDGANVELPTDSRIISLDEALTSADAIDLDCRVGEETGAAMICYTSGTTGDPKGVVYSHRSTWLHANACLSTALFSLSDADRVMPVVPMFHAGAWGLPYGAYLAGASLVMPGPDLSPDSLLELMESERVTVAGGVPTIWAGMVGKLADRDLSSLRMVICGGSAVPRTLSERWRAETGTPITQVWGMTELSPIGAVNYAREEVHQLSEAEQADVRATQGIAPPGIELRIVDPGSRAELPWDDVAAGELEVRGPWVARQYYRNDSLTDTFTDDGWLRTGDIAAISPLGYLRLIDRTKDLVKSGGEWISSVVLENQIMAHPKVFEAAVIAIPHETWGERPLACVVAHHGHNLDQDELLSFLRDRVGSWQVPDRIVFVPEIPKTSVGKYSKKALRDQFAAGTLG